MERLKELEELRDLVYKHINDSLNIQKTRFNKGRKNVRYFVTDKVLKKSHVLSDAAKGVNAKLEPVYEGPYTITNVIAPYVYKLDMGDSRKIDIVHFSELKKFREPRNTQLSKEINKEINKEENEEKK